MQRHNAFACFCQLLIQVSKHAAGWLCRGWDFWTHGFQTVVEFIWGHVGRVDFTFRKLDVQGGFDDSEAFTFLGGQVCRAVGYDFHVLALFQI